MKRKFDHPAPSQRELAGPKYWRSLDELADTPGFREHMAREFPEGASSMEGVDRRQFMRLMAASFALGGLGLAGCRRPEMQRCVDENNKVVDDSLCANQSQQGVQQQHPDGHGGFVPIILPYHYYYGGWGGYALGSLVGGGMVGGGLAGGDQLRHSLRCHHPRRLWKLLLGQ